MALGSVKWFNDKKGYGFIRPDEGARDVFVHISAVKQAGLETLEEGARLEFALTQNREGKTQAIGLKPLPGSPDNEAS
ncbi:MAG: cold-shock protein [Pseudomonadota bacterium]